ncbi:MAG TPA: hypothetical protein VF791_20260 [Pyrinomonadaceae bacterium]
MKFRVRTLSQLSFTLVLALLLSTNLTAKSVPPVAAAGDKMKPEEVISKHLESIGTEDARAKIKSHVILGTAVGTYRIGGSGSSEGGSVLASQGTRNLVAIIYNNKEFPYEKLGYDGKTVTVADLRPGRHSVLGNFFMQHEMPLKEGLLGGTLSAAWPLLNVSERDPKLKYAGTKKIDGRQLHALEYQAKNNSGLKTTLYFDAQTFQHVRTEYEKRLSQQMPTGPSVTQQQGEAITKLVEEFSDFKPEGGLTLPHAYKLQLSIESMDRRILMDWVFTLTKFSFNNQLDDSQFDVRGSGNKT